MGKGNAVLLKATRRMTLEYFMPSGVRQTQDSHAVTHVRRQQEANREQEVRGAGRKGWKLLSHGAELLSGMVEKFWK